MNKIIYIVGKPFEDQINYLKENNFMIGLFADKNIDNSDFKNEIDFWIDLDFSNKSYLDEIPNDIKIDGIIARYENYILYKAEIATKLGLDSPSIESAKYLTDKVLMRQAFMNYDERITPNFRKINSIEDAKSFVKEFDYPVITKPTNLVKSLLITISRNESELISNLNHTFKNIKDLYKKYNSYREPNIIIEEFMEGTKHSIAMFADKNGEIHSVNDVIDLQMAFDLGLDDGYIYSRTLPSALDLKRQNLIKEVAKKGMKALKLTSTPGHVEIIYTEKGPKIIEIGGRIGGYRSQMHLLGNNINLDKVEVDLALSNSFDLVSKSEKFISVIELFPKKEGKFLEIQNIDQIEGNNEIKLKQRVQKGDKVGKAEDGYKFSARVTIISENRNNLEKNIEMIKNLIIKVE